MSHQSQISSQVGNAQLFPPPSLVRNRLNPILVQHLHCRRLAGLFVPKKRKTLFQLRVLHRSDKSAVARRPISRHELIWRTAAVCSFEQVLSCFDVHKGYSKVERFADSSLFVLVCARKYAVPVISGLLLRLSEYGRSKCKHCLKFLGAFKKETRVARRLDNCACRNIGRRRLLRS